MTTFFYPFAVIPNPPITPECAKRVGEIIIKFMELADSGDFAEGDREAFKDRYGKEITDGFGPFAEKYLRDRLDSVGKRQ